MAPAVLDEVPTAVSTNIPDDAAEAHPKDLDAGEGTLPDQPNKENVIVRPNNTEVSNQSEFAIVVDDDDLFKDENNGEDDDDGFVPRGKGVTYTDTKKAPGSGPLKQKKPLTAAPTQTHGRDSDSDAAPGTKKSKDVKGQNKNAKPT